MKIVYLLVSVVCLGGIILYYNRLYARIYNTIGDYDLPAPTPTSYTLTNTSSLRHEPFTYVAYGDSLTSGVGSESYDHTYVYALAKHLTDRYATVTVYNKGVPGATSADVAAETRVPMTPASDLATILIGVNDMHNFVSRTTFKNNVMSSIQHLRASRAKRIVLIGFPYLGAPSLVAAPYRWWFNYRTTIFNATLESVAREAGVEYTNLYPSTYSALNHDGAWYAKDLFHPSGTEYVTWGDQLYAHIPL